MLLCTSSCYCKYGLLFVYCRKKIILLLLTNIVFVTLISSAVPFVSDLSYSARTAVICEPALKNNNNNGCYMKIYTEKAHASRIYHIFISLKNDFLTFL